MDIFDEEIILFWKTLQDNVVKYIVVGGYAANLHGYQLYTGDMDIWLEDTPENRKNFRRAYHIYTGTDFFMIETMQFVPGFSNLWLNNGMTLNIMVGMKGLEMYTFDECLQVVQIAEIDGVTVNFLHINHLIANKKAVNRDKDKLDVINLEKIKKLQDEANKPPPTL